jgi:hypothetical protein
METFLSICLGLGLAASCGFRVFVPLLVMSVAAQADMLQLSGSFEWIGSLPALIILAVATGLEIAAYYVPWLDNLLDTIAGPAAVVAGVIVTASTVTGIDPVLKWSLAVIAGGGAAATVQGITTLARGASTLTTAGFGNFAVSTAEAGGSVFLSVLALFMPVLALLLLVGFTFFMGRGLNRWQARRRSLQEPAR